MNNNKCLPFSPYSIQNLLCSCDTTIATTATATLAPILKPTKTYIKINTIPFIELPRPKNGVIKQHHLMKKDIQPLQVICKPASQNSFDQWKNRKVWNYQYNHSEDDYLKIRRKRATAKQTQALQKVFERTAFPSTILRENLARHLDMSPRTVQIWFQNKRQAVRKIFR